MEGGSGSLEHPPFFRLEPMNKAITIDFCIWLQRNFDALIASWAELSQMEGMHGLTPEHNQVALPNGSGAAEAPVAIGSGERTAQDDAKEALAKYQRYEAIREWAKQQWQREQAEIPERKSWWDKVMG